MNKNGQHSYKLLMIFHFGITKKSAKDLNKSSATAEDGRPYESS